MYRCISKACDENIDFNLCNHQDIILHSRETEFAFRPRILLSCGHSVCEKCIYTAVTVKQEEFIKCDDCGVTTSYSRQTIQTIKVNRPRLKESVRWNEDCEEELIYEAFSIGAAFNSGRISVSATPIVDLDESLVDNQNLPSHSYRNEAEVLAIREKVSNASDSFKAAVADGISMYSACGSSLKYLFDTKTALNKQFVSTKEAIRKRFHVLHGLLQLEEASLIKELINSKDNAAKSLKEKEKSIESFRGHIKGIIMRSPQYAHIQSHNPFKIEIDQCRLKPLRIDGPPELPDHLPGLSINHDELQLRVRKLCDFRKAVHFDISIAFNPLISSDKSTPSIPGTLEVTKRKVKPLSYIRFIKQQLVTIHDVKDSGYFSAHLPVNETTTANLSKALNKWCGPIRHPPSINKIKPSADVVVWHDQKLRWVRAKFKRIIEDIRQSDKENFYLLRSNLSSKKVEVTLIDYADEIYETFVENLRESCALLTDPNSFPPLHKVWKCRLKNIQPLSPHLRAHVLKFCATDMKVRLLILSEPVGDIYDVDVVHDIRDLVNPHPTLIEYLIFSGAAKLKSLDSQSKFPYPNGNTVFLKYGAVMELKIGAVYSVDVTCIRTPSAFYVVSSREREEIESIEKKINELYSLQDKSIALRLYVPKIWIPCAARCELFWDKKKKRGKMFHRGYVIPNTGPTPPSMVEFFALDYGESIHVNLADLRVLPDCYVSALPRTAIQCSLANIAPLDSKNWSQNSITAFTEFFAATDTPTGIKVVGKVGKVYRVILNLHKYQSNHPDGNINEILIQDGFAMEKRENLEQIDLTDDNPIASTSNNQRSNRTNRHDYNCFSLLQDMVRKSKANHLDTVDSLIPVKITAFNSPESFYIQINTPEAQIEINNYVNRLNEEYEQIDIDRAPLGQMQSFKVGEQCIYLFRTASHFSNSWRRGIIIDFLGLEGPGANKLKANDSTDPRQMKQVTPHSKYKVRDRDFGQTVIVKRKDILQLPQASPYRKDGEKCIQVAIPGIKPIGEQWSNESIEYCNLKLRRYHGKLFIKVEEILTSMQPEKIPVDCIFFAVEIPDACLPSEDHYYSLRFDLLESGNATLVSDDLHFEKELKIPDDSTYNEIEIPLSLRDSSLLSSLRASCYVENQPVEQIKYMDARRPDTNEFNAICTHIEDGPCIWFTLIYDSPHEPSIGTINKTILRKIFNKEKLQPFRGNAEVGRACTVHDDTRWYRAEIKSNVDNKITVIHVDTGATKDYFLDKMSDEIFCEGIPKLALFGRLYRAVPFVDRRTDAPIRLKHYLTTHLIGKRIKVTWENFGADRDMLISVYLEDKARDLKSLLLNLDLVQESQGEEDLPQYVRTSIEFMEKSEFNLLNHQFTLDKYYPVIIADFVKENYLYIQLVNFSKPGDQISDEEKEINRCYAIYKRDEEYINTHTLNFPHAIEFYHGNSCCAKWNDEWFRGIVTRVVVPKAKYEVFFVDWGNTDVIDLADMRIIPDLLGMKGHPIFGFFVRMCDIKPARQGVWTQRLYDTMKATVDSASDADKNFLIKFKSNSIPYDVELWLADANQNPVEPFFSDLIRDGFLESC